MNATTKPGFPQQKPIGPWASKPLMLQALPPQCLGVLIRPGNIRKPYYEEASAAVEAMFIAKSTFMWQASVGRHSKAVQWGSYVFLQKNQPVFQKFRWTEYVNIKKSGLPNSPRNPFRPLEAEQVVILALSCLPCEKSTLCVLFLIFNLKLKSGVSIQTSKATSPRELFSIWRVWHSSKS